MKTSPIIAFIIGLVLLGSTGCGSKAEQAQNKMVSATDDMADALAGIKSNADLAGAKPRLAKAVAKMNEAMTEAMSLPADQQKPLDPKMEAAMNKADQRVQQEIARLDSAGVAIGEVFSSIGAPVGMFR